MIYSRISMTDTGSRKLECTLRFTYIILITKNEGNIESHVLLSYRVWIVYIIYSVYFGLVINDNLPNHPPIELGSRF